MKILKSEFGLPALVHPSGRTDLKDVPNIEEDGFYLHGSASENIGPKGFFRAYRSDKRRHVKSPDGAGMPQGRLTRLPDPSLSQPPHVHILSPDPAKNPKLYKLYLRPDRTRSHYTRTAIIFAPTS